MATIFKPYFIECISNLHVGSGDTNYGIVDKMVQRDVVTSYPTIHSTSLKGALRAHFEDKWNTKDPITGKDIVCEKIKTIFGSDGNDGDTGDFKFLSADLVALPVRCTHESYVMALCESNINSINKKAELLIVEHLFNDINKLGYFEGNAPLTNNIYSDYSEESGFINEAFSQLNLTTSEYKGIDTKCATFENDSYSRICNELPIIARNRLGENKNLWYEEVVPYKTLFITYIGMPDNHTTKTEFEGILKDELIQIGANASVGYGLCKFYPITFQKPTP